MLRDSFRVCAKLCPSSGRPARLPEPEIRTARDRHAAERPIRDRGSEWQARCAPTRNDAAYLASESSSSNFGLWIVRTHDHADAFQKLTRNDLCPLSLQP